MSISPQPALRARRRSNPVAQYLLALAVTITAYVAYAVFAIPALEGTPAEIQRPRRTTVTSKPTQRDKTWLRAFVPADGWEWQSCKTLTVAGGTILFRDYQPLDGGYAEVFPLTLVMNAKPPRADGVAVPIDPNKTPVIVRCPERVQLKFDRPMSEGFTDGKLQLESARLVGPVTIYRPESQPGADDGLSVLTRNLQIDRTKLFTLEDVKFAYGPHLGHGRHLTVELERSSESGTQSTLNAGFGDISGVRQIKLASLSKLRLEPKRPKSGGTRQTLAQSKAEPRGDLFSDQGAPIEISCRGPFQFDLQQRVAILNDQVAVDQIGTTTESLRCDGLRLAFSPDASEHLQPVRVEAWGNAARVVSASRETAITAQHFTYDVVTGRFEATSEDQVTIVNPDLQLATRKIDCTITPGRPLGSVEAVGPGKLIRNTRDQDSGMQVSWQQRLRVRKEDGLQRVQISWTYGWLRCQALPRPTRREKTRGSRSVWCATEM